ncbi:AbrB/MazE/SpoVT family DNA-binding domain-containing protein [Asticcacaulis sp. 201]|uniref:AbrB/MazE/SpoVT family DNA-binding domain-containing protein n=1 Tax=Asticcacaulis sp. 201 TaxID=3028787 RepID=UPI002916F2F1|nr:AbrB/MazE/SpoVT family DNA-binding domain-containing protein [Asticcacaulis sp. 201]MDV6331015.1 AbrB/MazE/SpoVT family DNA-binding domain-containing protein [Asticcacaulis sp. 201]
MELKITKIGNSLGVILPRELLTRLKLEKGDTIFITETPDGYRLSPYDPAYAEQMHTARELMKKRRNVVHELSK